MDKNKPKPSPNDGTVLVTGAGGKTGRTVVSALLGRNIPVRVLVYPPELVNLFPENVEIVAGDMTVKADLEIGFRGVKAVYHICPNMHPAETEIGKQVIEVAKSAGVQHFVYHSVLHPQVKEMPHHWNKMQVEGLLFKSGLNYTIIQPTAYYQNLLQYKNSILEQGIYSVPYHGNTRVGMVDLSDIAEIVSMVIGHSSYYGGTYELATDDVLSQNELTALFSRILKRDIRFEEYPRSKWDSSMKSNGMDNYARITLLKMFEYYEKHGFRGNAKVLTMLLGRAPTSLDAFIKNTF